MNARVLKRLLLWSWLAAPLCAMGQTLELHVPTSAPAAATTAVMRDLAERILPVYQENNRDIYLTNLSALQMVAGDYGAADATRRQLRDLLNERPHPISEPTVARQSLAFDIYAHARALATDNRVPFVTTFTRSFRDVVNRLDDKAAYPVTAWFTTPVSRYQEYFQQLLDVRRGQTSISMAGAIDMLWSYLAFDAHRNAVIVADAVVAEDARERYDSDEQIVIKTAGGAQLVATVVRPRSGATRLPTLLDFEADVNAPNFAEECAAHGYVGVITYTRGVPSASGKVTPFEHDADDAAAVVSWIAKQSWSDGRVGMYGVGYSAFAAWAATKHLPKALKAIAVSSAMAPGIDTPLLGNIYRNDARRWLYHISTDAVSGEEDMTDDAYWDGLDRAWYSSGHPYNDLVNIDGKPYPAFATWLAHPSYEHYWHRMIPSQQEFAHLSIPVLATSGYFDPDLAGTLYYFTQHTHATAHADDTLLVGPFDSNAMQRGADPWLRGYGLDVNAQVDLHELRYQWFDHILRGGPQPTLLQGRVNFEVMGANEWRHANSIETMANTSVRWYLDSATAGQTHRLVLQPPQGKGFVEQRVDFADRSDANWTPATELVTRDLGLHNAVAYVSDPLPQTIDVSGLLSGKLDFEVNKWDMDLVLSLYEQLPDGQYLRLFDPAYAVRASYLANRSQRKLLQSGKRQQLSFRIEHLTSRRLNAGSRLVVVLGINKRPDEEINYGTGKDVAQESIMDASKPLQVRWHADSYLDLPVTK